MAEFSGKVALVTGASRRIGRAIAIELAERGADIAFNYLRNRSAAEDTMEQVKRLGVNCLMVKSHLGEPEKIIGLFQLIENEFGVLDILVNNAATGVQRSAEDLEVKHWDWTMNVNARAPWLCSVEAAKLMKMGGSIVNITSEGSRKVLPYYLSVGTSKAALETLTRYLAVELSAKGINVNAISGGYVDTGALSTFPNRDKMLSAGKNTLAGRMITAMDIAKVTAFLCSDNALMIRGQVIIVDGGVTLSANLSES